MKIAMIGQKGIPAQAGGVEKHVEEIASRLVSNGNGNEVTVYCRNTYLQYKIDEYKGIKLKIIKTINNKSLDAIVYTFRATIDALRAGYDIYHYHAIGPASLAFIPRLFGKKVVITVHGLDWQRDKWGKFAKAYLKFGEYITGNYSNKIISVSENLKDYFAEKYLRDKTDVIFNPNGVDIYTPLKANEIKKFNLEEKGYILFLARLVPEKGAHYLIEAFNQIKTDKKLVIAGGASFTENYVKKLYELKNNNSNIIFTGNVSGNLLRELYSNCSLYVLPSDIEGMPLTLLEALSYGKQCLTSDIIENKSVLGDKGIVFRKGDINDLKEKLDLLCNSNKYKHEENELINFIRQAYNWEEVVQKNESIYKSII